MKIDVTQVIKDLNDKPVSDGAIIVCPKCGTIISDESEAMTLRSVMIIALTTRTPPDARGYSSPIAGDVQFERFQLATRIKSDDVVELSIKEASTIQDLVAKKFAPVITGPIYGILNGVGKIGQQE